MRHETRGTHLGGAEERRGRRGGGRLGDRRAAVGAGPGAVASRAGAESYAEVARTAARLRYFAGLAPRTRPV
ncbi:hypothetical protein ACWEOA_37035, partial [Streptomyces sp. NPDC004457]